MINMIVVNLKTEQEAGNYSLLSEPLRQAMSSALQSKQKIVLFHNRTGQTRRTRCLDCRQVFTCQQCERPLQTTDATGQYYCANCRAEYALVVCPKCRSTRLKIEGYGHKRIQQEITAALATAAAISPGNDNTWSSWIKLFADAQVLIAGQLPIVDSLATDSLPISVAAILNADTDYALPDYDSGLRVFNRLRNFLRWTTEFRITTVLLQTYLPENSALQAAIKNDRAGFIRQELAARQKYKYPPSVQLIKLIYQHRDKDQCLAQAQKLFTAIQQSAPQLDITPPQFTWPARVRQNYRCQLIVKIAAPGAPGALITMLHNLPPAWLVDVDPISIL